MIITNPPFNQAKAIIEKALNDVRVKNEKPMKIKVKKQTKEQKQLLALKVLKADEPSIKPCSSFSPDCASCKLYLLEGMLEWYNELLKINI